MEQALTIGAGAIAGAAAVYRLQMLAAARVQALQQHPYVLPAVLGAAAVVASRRASGAGRLVALGVVTAQLMAIVDAVANRFGVNLY